MKDMISVIIPVYNAEKYIEKCLESILKQTYENTEIVCINDGSTDSSLEILSKYQMIYPDKLFIKTIPNAGQANARNEGMVVAKGKYFCFVDSDDTLNRSMLEKMYQKMIAESCDLVVCGIQRVYEGKPSVLERHFQYDTELGLERCTTIYEHPEIICFLTAAPFAKLIKKSFVETNKIQFVKNYIYEDLVFTQTLLTANPRISFMKDKLYNYLVRGNSTMTSKKSNVTDMFVSFTNFFTEYEKKGLSEEFREELDFLCLYHVMVGTSYRMFRSGRYSLTNAIMQCRGFCKKYVHSVKNNYMRKKGVLTYIFVRITLWKI